MNLRDLIYKKEFISIKISDVKNMLKIVPTDDTASKLVVLLDELQQVILNIHSANSQCFLTVGNNKIDLNSAVVIRDNLKRKIDIMTELINSNNDYTIDKLILMDQRDKFMDDYALLDMNIINTDINTRIG